MHVKVFTGGGRIWTAWFASVIAITCLFSITMSVAPFLHKDEFMIVDLGRVILNPETDWSIAWLTQNDSPVLLWSYLGPVLQELSFQAFGQYGPRISGLAGAIIASGLMVQYLLIKGTKSVAALLLSLVFLLDPLFVQSYSMGRVDGWAIAFCIFSFILLSAPVKADRKKGVKRLCFISGCLATIAFFIWPSAAILLPLIIYDLMQLYRKNRTIADTLLPFILGGILSVIAILSPLAPRIWEQLTPVVDGLLINLRYGSDSSEVAFSGYFLSVVELFRVLKFTPVLVLVAFASLVIRWDAGLFGVTTIAALIIVLTLVYIHRVLYLLPYLVLLSATLYRRGAHTEQFALRRFLLSKTPLIFLLTWAMGLSIGVRSVLALEHRDERDRELISRAAEQMIGAGHVSVMSTNEFYYSGRTLGWKMYAPYLAVGQPVSFIEMMNILPHVNYVLLQVRDLNNDLERALALQGFRVHSSYFIYASASPADDSIQTNIERIRNVYSIFPKPYGPYKLYGRKTKTGSVSYKTSN